MSKKNKVRSKIPQNKLGEELVKRMNTRAESGIIKILAWGAAPFVITGFGVVMRSLFSGLFNKYPGKYDLSLVGINHNGDFYDEFSLTGGVQNGRFRQWPAMQAGSGREHLYGQHKFLQLISQLDYDYDLIFLFEDPFWVGGPVPGMNPPTPYIDLIKNELSKRGRGHIPIVAYFPIDGIPKPEWIQNISKVDIPITYLEFGKNSCEVVFPPIKDKNLRIIPHGIDVGSFHPITDAEKNIFKRAMFGDDFANKFMVLNVNRNQLRKLIPSTLLAFKEFNKAIGGKAFLYLNMSPQDVGWNLIECCRSLGLSVGSDVLFPPNFRVQKGLSPEDLNNVFSSADMLVSTAVGGGWELSVTQAFATKTAVVAPANTSHIELCGDQTNLDVTRGLLYKSGDSLSRIMIFPNDNDVVRPLPNVEDMVNKMLVLYNNRELKAKLEYNAYKWVTSELEWNSKIVPQFDKIFTEAKSLKNIREGKQP